jgi:hypothetical protein
MTRQKKLTRWPKFSMRQRPARTEIECTPKKMRPTQTPELSIVPILNVLISLETEAEESRDAGLQEAGGVFFASESVEETSSLKKAGNSRANSPATMVVSGARRRRRAGGRAGSTSYHLPSTDDVYDQER